MNFLRSVDEFRTAEEMGSVLDTHPHKDYKGGSHPSWFTRFNKINKIRFEILEFNWVLVSYPPSSIKMESGHLMKVFKKMLTNYNFGF